jgi:hypothetical protein
MKAIEYRDLLKRYMRIVLANESVSFLDSYDDGSAAHTPVGQITAEELAELRRIESEAWADTRAAGG